MRRYFLLLSLCLPLFFSSCSNETETAPEVETAPFEFKGETFYSTDRQGTITINKKSDTVSINFPIEAGVSYQVKYTSSPSSEYYYVTAKTTPSDWMNSSTFIAKENGTATTSFSIQDEVINNSIPFTPVTIQYQIIRLKPIEPKLIGTWLLISREDMALGVSKKSEFSASDASSVISISSDSICYYSPNITGDKIEKYPTLLIYSEVLQKRYTVDDNRLTIGQSSENGYSVNTYIRYSGSIEELEWGQLTYKLPAELLGGWREISSKSMWIENGVVDEETDEIYSSIDDSWLVFSATADTIYKYYNEGDEWLLNKETPNSYGATFIRELDVDGDTATLKTVRFRSPEKYGYAIEKFIRFNGQIPQESWKFTRATAPKRAQEQYLKSLLKR